MVWYLLTKKSLLKMDGNKSIERIRSWPSKVAINTRNIAPDDLIVDLEREEPEFVTIQPPQTGAGTRISARSPDCDALVKKWEGYHKALANGGCAAYPDVAHGWSVATIGFGTTFYARDGRTKYGRKEVLEGDTLTRAQAESELDAELDICEAELLKSLKAPVTQGMFDALISFAFNLGMGGAQSQIDRVNAGKYEECARSFDLYVNANGRPFQGLINRRNDEEALFRSQGLNPVGAAVPKPIDIILLDVPYFSQRDHGGSQAWSICGVTSAAMVLKFWGFDVTPDTVLNVYGKAAGQSPTGLEGIFESNKLKADSTYKGKISDIEAHILAGRPCVVHGDFTASGHIMVVVGFDKEHIICNDPAGQWEQALGDSYSDNPKNGKAVSYKRDAFAKATGRDGGIWYSVAWK